MDMIEHGQEERALDNVFGLAIDMIEDRQIL
jgi:hypothetical protein